MPEACGVGSIVGVGLDVGVNGWLVTVWGVNSVVGGGETFTGTQAVSNDTVNAIKNHFDLTSFNNSFANPHPVELLCTINVNYYNR
jgi:hypothetical protein